MWSKIFKWSFSINLWYLGKNPFSDFDLLYIDIDRLSHFFNKLTLKKVDVICPRSSLSMSTSVGSSVFTICSIRIFRGSTPSTMLHCENTPTSPFRCHSTLLNCVTPSAVTSFQKTTSAFQCCYRSSTSVPEASFTYCCESKHSTCDYSKVVQGPRIKMSSVYVLTSLWIQDRSISIINLLSYEFTSTLFI